MEQAKKASYHRQVDAGENSHPAKYLKYIAGHDRAKKIMEQDYHLLPQRSNKEKMYYMEISSTTVGQIKCQSIYDSSATVLATVNMKWPYVDMPNYY